MLNTEDVSIGNGTDTLVGLIGTISNTEDPVIDIEPDCNPL